MAKLEELVRPNTTALLLVDLQNDFCHPRGYFGKQGACLDQIEQMMPPLQRLVKAAQEFAVHTIYIRTEHCFWTDSRSWLSRKFVKNGPPGEGSCQPKSWGADFFRVCPTECDFIVAKHRYSAFVKTELDLVLRSLRMGNVIVTGVQTNVCVDSSARHAFMLDYFVVVPEDCCATSAPFEDHQAALRLLEGSFAIVTTSKEIINSWRRYRQPVTQTSNLEGSKCDDTDST